MTLTAPQIVSTGSEGLEFARWRLINDSVVLLPIDEGNGTITRDISCNSNHGSISGAAWVETDRGTALDFDGIDDMVDCAGSESLDPGDAVTLSVWVNPDQVPSGEVGIAGKYFDQYLLSFYKYGRCWWYVGSGGNNCNATLPVGVWSHVVGTFDGTTMRLYINGEQVAEQASSFSTVPSGNNFWVGRHQSGEGTYFDGKVAAVKVYSRALSAAEVENEYQNGPEAYAGEPQPEEQNVLTTTLNQNVTVMAEYEDCSTIVNYYLDADGDGFGDPANCIIVTNCLVPQGYVLNYTDCNDADPEAYPYGPGDQDGDCDVDLSDFGHFQACLSGPNVPQNNLDCDLAKLDADDDVDNDDLSIFRSHMSKAMLPTDPLCGD